MDSDSAEPLSMQNIRQKVIIEIGPVVMHAIIVLVLEISCIAIGLLALLLELLFPEKRVYFRYIETIDIWLVLTLLSMFGVYTIILVGSRLIKSIRNEIS